MKRVIYMSKAWIAALLIGMVLVGCGGGGSGGGDSVDQGSSSSPDENIGGSPRSAVLSWSAPMTRVNGESIAMGELDRYVIRYGRDVDDLARTITVDGASGTAEMSYVVDSLAEGTWYFTIQVQDTAGLLSEPSEPVSKTIRS